MLVFRSFAIGLSAACFALLVMRPTVELRVTESPARAALRVPAPAAMRPTIIDAAPGITPAQLALTIRLEPGEQIASVDDVNVTSDLGAGILLASKPLAGRRYIDLGVVGPAGERRVIVLLH